MTSTTRHSDPTIPFGPAALFTVERSVKPQGTVVPMHAHEEAQLTVPLSGVMQVQTQAGRWLVPPQLAVWVPAGMAHRSEVLSDAELWVIKWRPPAVRDWAPASAPSGAASEAGMGPLDRAFALRVTPLLRALVPAAFAPDAAPAKRALAVRLVLHELTETPDAPTYLPLPTSPAGRRVAELAFADHRHRLDAEALASRAATSVRTLSRLFPAETGLTFKAWRQRARIVRALDRLCAGETVARVSSEAGFASTAAFSFAFRQVTAMTPTAFLDRRAAS